MGLKLRQFYVDNVDNVDKSICELFDNSVQPLSESGKTTFVEIHNLFMLTE